MSRRKRSEDVATEPFAAREDVASGTIDVIEKTSKRSFVFQKLVAVHHFNQYASGHIYGEEGS